MENEGLERVPFREGMNEHTQIRYRSHSADYHTLTLMETFLLSKGHFLAFVNPNPNLPPRVFNPSRCGRLADGAYNLRIGQIQDFNHQLISNLSPHPSSFLPLHPSTNFPSHRLFEIEPWRKSQHWRVPIYMNKSEPASSSQSDYVMMLIFHSRGCFPSFIREE